MRIWKLMPKQKVIFFKSLTYSSVVLKLHFDLAEPETPVSDNPALTTSLKAYTSLTKEQKTVLARTLDGFISCLAPVAGTPDANPRARTVISEEAWNHRASWGRDEWNAWETWCWYRHFCRLVSSDFDFFLSKLGRSHLLYACCYFRSTLRTSASMRILWTLSRFPSSMAATILRLLY